MKKFASVCAGIALVASAVAVKSWLDLRKEREAGAALLRQLNDGQYAVSAYGAPTPQVTLPAAAAAAPPAMETHTGNQESPVQATPMNAALALVQGAANRQKELLKDPEYREMFKAQLSATLRRGYPGLADELGLTEKEADSLFDLLAENQISRSTESPPFSTPGAPGADPEALRQHQLALRNEREKSIQALLGGRYAQWQTYEQTLPARTRVTTMGTQLAQAGKPLTQAQSKALTTAMIAEQQRQAQEARLIPPAPSGSPAEAREQTLRRLEENNRHTLEAAAPYINADQLAALRRQMEQQAVMTRALSAQMEREQVQ